MTRGPDAGRDTMEQPALHDAASSSRPATSTRSRLRWAPDVVVFTLIIVIGVSRLPAPFTGDQALNMLMGRVIANGGAPYVELWDLKHPGIFFFFAAGGTLFGFDEIGIHLFELVWMIGLAVTVWITARQYLRNRIAVALAPLLTVGFYYVVATNVHLTQTEGLVGLPMLLSLLLAARAVRPDARNRWGWLFASGVSAGLVAVFKAPYVVIPCIFWVLVLVEWRRAQSIAIGRGVRVIVLPLVAGMLIPATATVAYLAQKHALGLAWWTFVDYPRQVAAEAPLGLGFLRDSTLWFARTFSVPLVLAIIGAWDRLRRGWDLLTAAFVAWVVSGAILIWAQVIGWWSYHYLLLLVPVGLLAAQGAETLGRLLLDHARAGYRRAVVASILFVLMVLSLSPVGLAARSVSDFLGARPLPLTRESARAFQIQHDHAYADASRTTSFLRGKGGAPGPIYAFASPILYVLADRSPAIPSLATWFAPTREAWHRMMTQLTERPPRYILVNDGALRSFVAENPTLTGVDVLRSWLAERYRVLRTDVGGTWYERA